MNLRFCSESLVHLVSVLKIKSITIYHQTIQYKQQETTKQLHRVIMLLTFIRRVTNRNKTAMASPASQNFLLLSLHVPIWSSSFSLLVVVSSFFLLFCSFQIKNKFIFRRACDPTYKLHSNKELSFFLSFDRCSVYVRTVETLTFISFHF